MKIWINIQVFIILLLYYTVKLSLYVWVLFEKYKGHFLNIIPIIIRKDSAVMNWLKVGTKVEVMNEIIV